MTISTQHQYWDKSDILSLRLPWGQLTYLDLFKFKPFTSHSIHTLLIECPNLVTFTLCIMPIDNDNSITLPLIELRYLESLAITGGNKFLQYLRLPALKYLSDDSPLARLVADLFKRSGCHIETLKIRGYIGNTIFNRGISPMMTLEETPFLRTLALDCDESLRDIFQRMAHDRGTFRELEIDSVSNHGYRCNRRENPRCSP